MEIYDDRMTAINWAGQIFSVAEDIAQEMANHWFEIHESAGFENEELVLKFLPMAIDILKNHPEFTNASHWEF